MTRAASDREVRSLLLAGSGRAFCAGGDVKAMLGTAEDASAGGPPMSAARAEGVGELHRALSGLYRLPMPVVAAVHGPCAGAGVWWPSISSLASS